MHPKTVKKHLKQLREECIDGVSDPVLKRIAYAMETAVTRVTRKTVGWPSLAEEACREAALLREELSEALARELVRR